MLLFWRRGEIQRLEVFLLSHSRREKKCCSSSWRGGGEMDEVRSRRMDVTKRNKKATKKRG